MRRSIIFSTLLIGAAALGVAACGGDDNSGSDGAAAGASGAIVSVAKLDGTSVLADDAGKTLYSAAVEEGGMIRCVDGCTSFWEPVAATSADAKQARDDVGVKLGTVKRPDGQQQLTFDGLPLYTFADEGAGKLQGDGFADDFQGTHFEWQAARTGGGSAPSDSSAPSGDYGY